MLKVVVVVVVVAVVVVTGVATALFILNTLERISQGGVFSNFKKNYTGSELYVYNKFHKVIHIKEFVP